MTRNTVNYMSYVDAAAKVMRNVMTRLKSDEEGLKDFKEKCKENSPGVAEFIENVLESEPLFCTESDVKEYIGAMRGHVTESQKSDVRAQIGEAVRRLRRESTGKMPVALREGDEEINAKWATGNEQLSIQDQKQKAEQEDRDGDRDRDVEKLKPESQKGNEETVMNAALTLGRIGDSSAVKPLIEVLESEYPSVRAAAAWALGNIGDVSAIEPLEELLKIEKSEWAKGYLREALEKISAKSAMGSPQSIVHGPQKETKDGRQKDYV